MRKNDDFSQEDLKIIKEIKDSASEYEIPDKVTPDKIKERLDAENHTSYIKPKKKRIMTLTFSAAAIIVFVIVGLAIYNFDSSVTDADSDDIQLSMDINTAVQTVASAESYDEIYEVLEEIDDYDYDYSYSDVYTESDDTATDSDNEVTDSEEVAMDSVTDESTDSISDDSSNDESSSDEDSSEYSDTNEQVEGVHESDVVKTDGQYIYSMESYGDTISIFDADTNEVVSEISLDEWQSDSVYLDEMYYSDDKIIIIGTYYDGSYYYDDSDDSDECIDQTLIYTFDVSDRENPVLDGVVAQDGYYYNSRMVDSIVYIFSEYYVYDYSEDYYIPSSGDEDIAAEDIYYTCDIESASYVVISSVDVDNPDKVIDSQAILGDYGEIYVDDNSIYVTSWGYEETDEASYDYTEIMKLSFEDGTITGEATAKIKGYIDDQFSLDEYDGYLRVLTTVDEYINNTVYYEVEDDDDVSVSYDDEEIYNVLYVLDDGLNISGEIDDIASGETIQSARFLDDMGYFVTYENTDPLFAVDLSDPENPEILSELKITGFSSYLHIWSDDLLLGIGYETDEDTSETLGIKLTMFDISDPSNVTVAETYEIDSYDWATFSDTHKAVLVDTEKNLIGFVAEDYSYDDNSESDSYSYFLFSYSDSEFTLLNSYELYSYEYDYTTDEEDYLYDYDAYNIYDVRGLYINDYLYIVVPGYEINVIDLDTYEEIESISLE